MPLLESSQPDDEYFLVTFNKTVSLIQAFTENSAEVQNQITYQQASGWTALYDAVYMGLDHVRRGKNEKKALILITDGEDNSRYRTSEVREYCRNRCPDLRHWIAGA
jgi:Ca-activated chloride channel family protein